MWLSISGLDIPIWSAPGQAGGRLTFPPLSGELNQKNEGVNGAIS